MTAKANASWDREDRRVDDLILDARNPRLRDAGLDEQASQPEIRRALWQLMAVDELALSIAHNGFFPHEPLFVAKEHGELVVVEGNRRLAAVQLLRDPKLRAEVGALSLPTISPEARKRLDTVPTVLCKREDIWTFIGFKHINGPQAWDSYPKAHYVAWVRNELNKPLEVIAEHIGDKHDTVARLYDALMVLEQAEDAGVFNRETRHKKHFSFSHLSTGLGYTGIRRFLGLSPGSRPIGKKRPVPKSHEKHLGELLLWLYGNRTDDIPAVVRTQNPDLRRLDLVLQSEQATTAIRKRLPLEVALEISYGDDRVFREALVVAKQSLQKARGTVLTAYDGNEDLLKTADEIAALATSLLSEMNEMQQEAGAERPRRGR